MDIFLRGALSQSKQQHRLPIASEAGGLFSEEYPIHLSTDVLAAFPTQTSLLMMHYQGNPTASPQKCSPCMKRRSHLLFMKPRPQRKHV